MIAAFCTLVPLSEALAQTAPPPFRQNIDANGVDLLLGTYNISSTDVSLGDTKSVQGLALKRYWQGALLRYNVMASMTLSGSVMAVSIGNVSDNFSVLGDDLYTDAWQWVITDAERKHFYVYRA